MEDEKPRGEDLFREEGIKVFNTVRPVNVEIVEAVS